MIETILNTGLLSVQENYHNEGTVLNGVGGVDNNDVVNSEITINGQVLLETLPEITTVGQRDVISNSGEFYLSDYELRDTTGYFDLGFTNTALKYDLIRSGEHVFIRAATNALLSTGFSGSLNAGLTGDYVFLNGIKLVSGAGESFIEDANGNFSWTDPDTNITGLLFSMPSRDHLYSSGVYDEFGIEFNKGTSTSFLNGVKLDELDFLETASVVTSIETGLSPNIEFYIPPDPQATIFL